MADALSRSWPEPSVIYTAAERRTDEFFSRCAWRHSPAPVMLNVKAAPQW
jgi:hypothetical protein